MTYYRLTGGLRFWRNTGRVAFLDEERIFPIGTVVVDDPEKDYFYVMEEPTFARRVLEEEDIEPTSPLELLALEAP